MAEITTKRRDGNSTRQIDEMIQELFRDGQTVVRDHAHRETPNGVPSNFAREHTLKTMLRRLDREHDLEMHTHLEYDRASFVLKFKQ
jgi:hypothetical protein